MAQVQVSFGIFPPIPDNVVGLLMVFLKFLFSKSLQISFQIFVIENLMWQFYNKKLSLNIFSSA